MSDFPNCFDWMVAGHYIADCEEQPGQWVTYNDKHVTLASEEATLKARRRTAYILFYIKRVIYMHSYTHLYRIHTTNALIITS